MKRIGMVFVLWLLAGCSGGMPATLDHPSADQELVQTKNGLSIGLAKDSYEGLPEQLEIILRNGGRTGIGYGEYVYVEV